MFDTGSQSVHVRQCWRTYVMPCRAGLIQIMPGPTTKKIRRSDGKWLVIEITIASIVRRARFDKFDLASDRDCSRARFGSPPKSRKIVISQNRERARNIGADRSNKRRIGLFLSLLMAMARPGFISQSPALKSIPFSSSLDPLSSFDTHAIPTYAMHTYVYRTTRLYRVYKKKIYI